MAEHVQEWSIEGLPGPAHNFAGLALGNIASRRHRFEVSRPRQAALQALDKMHLVHSLGVPVAIMPPQERPCLSALRRAGFSGSETEILERASREAPALFSAAWSSSAMWTANAATVSPASDCADGRVHITPANLVSQFHRSIEVDFTANMLRILFPEGESFAHHPPLPANLAMRDEGAANHNRLCFSDSEPGFELFVYGDDGTASTSQRFSARQTLAASQAIARLHRLDPARTFFLAQNPAAIDAGVFHNDVIAVANERVFLHHARAFRPEGAATLETIAEVFPELCSIRIEEEELTIAEAVDSYLFNSQLMTLSDGTQAIIAPAECREQERPRACLERIVDSGENPIAQVQFVALRESMKNGGGPACLRLRAVLGEIASQSVPRGLRYESQLGAALRDWVAKHYREELRREDLLDPNLIRESRAALDELTGVLGIGPVYEFQKF